MANQYIFFDTRLRERFVQFAADRGIASEVWPDTMQGAVVELTEELSEEVIDLIEDEYESLMLEQMAALEADENEADRSVIGVNVALSDGETCVVRIPADLGRRLFEVFSTEEIHDLVGAITHSVKTPSKEPLCKKV